MKINTGEALITAGLVIFLVSVGLKSCDDKQAEQRQANINHVFDAACQRAGGVTVPSIEPGLVHCVQPVDGILEVVP